MLQIDHDSDYECKSHFLQRVGWVTLAIMLTLGLLGAWGGNGPLSDTTVEINRIAVSYERFLRQEAPMNIKIAAHELTSGKRSITLSFSKDFFTQDFFRVERIQPDNAEIKQTDHELTIELTENLRMVQISLIPQSIGKIHLFLSSGDEVRPLELWVYP